MNNYLVIMAGGVGSRFWPASRESNPKQFLDILGTGKSLIRLTYERFSPIIPASNIFVITHDKYKTLILEHIPEIKEDQVICEPSRNNTAPCVAYAALKLLANNKEANIIVSPADHIILKEGEFHRIITESLRFTQHNDAIVTLGLKPTRPDTGYGYIETDEYDSHAEIKKAKRFTEKPKLELAKEYMGSGKYVWNSGLFIFKAETILKSFEEYSPEITNLLSNENIEYNTESEISNIRDFYPKTPSISIDYAIMEKAQNIYTYPAEIGWSDLGTWKSLFEECPKDSSENVVQADHAILKSVSNSLIRMPKNKIVIVKGLDDFMIIDEKDVLVIYPKSGEQEIKSIRKEVSDQFGEASI